MWWKLGSAADSSVNLSRLRLVRVSMTVSVGGDWTERERERVVSVLSGECHALLIT